MVKIRTTNPTRRSWRYCLRNGRLHFYLFYFSRTFNILFFKHLHLMHKSRKHIEYYFFFYFSKIFLQLNPKKIYILTVFNWYKNKYYNLSDFYQKYSTDVNNFYFFSFIKKYFYKWKELQNKHVSWNEGSNSILFLKNCNLLNNDDIENKLEEIDENYVNYLEIKDFNYLNFCFEIDEITDFKSSFDFNFFENIDKYFFLEYYKIFIILIINKSFKF